MDFPHDIWGYLFTFFYSESIETSLNLRVNRSSNDAFLKLIKKQPNIYPQQTFIQMNTCMHCERFAKSIACITYLHDEYPKRQLLFCKKFECLLHALGRFIEDSNSQRVFPFVKFEKKRVWIPRSSGGFSVGQIRDNSPISIDRYGNICVFVRMAEKVVFNSNCEPYNEHNFTLEKKVIISLIKNIGSIHINSIFCKLFTIKINQI